MSSYWKYLGKGPPPGVPARALTVEEGEAFGCSKEWPTFQLVDGEIGDGTPAESPPDGADAPKPSKASKATTAEK